MSIGLIEDLGGIWARPFVTDGDPYRVDGAIIGLNPATPIATKCSREKFYELIQDRQEFERFYDEIRRERGERRISQTRSRLRLLVAGLPGNIAETNVNALPAKNAMELRHSKHCKKGKEIAEKYLSQIQPKFIVIYSVEALQKMKNSGYFSPGEKSQDIDSFTERHVDARWNDKPTLAFSIPKLVRPPEGWTDNAIREVTKKIRKLI